MKINKKIIQYTETNVGRAKANKPPANGAIGLIARSPNINIAFLNFADCSIQFELNIKFGNCSLLFLTQLP